MLYHFPVDDEVTKKYTIVNLFKDGIAKRSELASAFKVAESTIYRWEQKYDQDGISALERKKRDSKPSKVTKPVEKTIKFLFKQDWSKVRIARKLGISEKSVRNALKRMKLEREERFTHSEIPFKTEYAEGEPASNLDEYMSTEDHTPNVESAPDSTSEISESSTTPSQNQPESENNEVVKEAASSTNDSDDTLIKENISDSVNTNTIEDLSHISLTLDTDPHDRSGDRFLARLGLLDDANPLFGSGKNIPFLGFLLAVPFIVSN